MTSLSIDARRELAARVGVAVFLASWAMVFVALLFSHLLLESQIIGTRPALPVGLAALSTGLLLLSTFAARLANQRHAAVISAAIGLGFVAMQALLWAELSNRGLWPQDSQLASSLYALTGFHAVHVAVGIGGLLWVAARNPRGLRWWRLYWDFVALAWLAIFMLGFVL